MVNIFKFVWINVYMTICVPKCSDFVNSKFEIFFLLCPCFQVVFWRLEVSCLTFALSWCLRGCLLSVFVCHESSCVFCSCFDIFCRASTHLSRTSSLCPISATKKHTAQNAHNTAYTQQQVYVFFFLL